MNNEEKLITENMKLAYSQAWKYKRLYKWIDLDELISICLLGLTQAAKGYDENKNNTFSTYACRVMKNEIIHFCQDNSKHECISLNEQLEGDSELQDMIASESTEMDTIEKKLESDFLYEQIEKLDTEYKEIVLLILKGCTQREIAETKQIPQSKVNSIYNKALNELRRLYGE